MGKQIPMTERWAKDTGITFYDDDGKPEDQAKKKPKKAVAKSFNDVLAEKETRKE